MKNNSIKENKKQDRMEENKAKKIKNMKFLNIIKGKVGDTMLEIIENCSKFMMFYADESKEKLKLMKSNSCKNRFCPMCSWRKAKKDALKNSIIMKKLIADNKYAFLFLTLTAPSVTGEELENEIKDYADVEKNYTYRDRLRSFNVGHSAIYAGGIDSEQKINPKLKMEYAMFPDKNNKDVDMVSAYPGYFIGSSSDTKQKEACIRFLKYMLSEKVQT